VFYLIGQAPSKLTGESDGAPFSGNSGRRLARALEIDHEALLERFEARNLIDFYPGRSEYGGDRFPIEAASLEANTLRDSTFCPGDVVLLAGRNVARAFGYRDADFLEWYVEFAGKRPLGGRDRRVVLYAVVPHPSGLNIFYTRPENVERLRAFFRPLLEGTSVWIPR
jgi:uracil-DNA glycosylase